MMRIVAPSAVSVLALAMLAGLLVSAPQWLHQMDDRYEGLHVRMNDDEASYNTHLQEALLGRFGQAGKGITADAEEDPSFHVSPIEEVAGVLFGWTGLRAPEVYQIMDFVIPFLLTLALVALFSALGFSRWESYTGSGLFILLQLANLNRPVHPRTSFLLLVLALLCMLRAPENKYWSVAGGALMGLLLGVYVWGWMAAWAVWGVMLLLSLMARETKRIRSLLWTGGFGLLFALPFASHLLSIRSHPAYADTVERTGLTAWRLPESWPWSALFFVMAVALITLWIGRGKRKEEIAITALPLAGLLVFNQQLLHGFTLMFRAHFLFFLAFVAIAVLLYGVRVLKASRSALAGIAAVAALVIVGALAFENRKVVGQWSVDESDFTHQYLAIALPILDELPRSVILSDPGTSAFISGTTHHDVVFTPYLQHTLATHEELATAFCLTQLPIPAELRNLEEQPILALGNAVWSQIDPVRRDELRAKDLALTEAACERLDQDPLKALRDAGVEYVFWNEWENPAWDLTRLPEMEQAAGDEGWTLWKIR